MPKNLIVNALGCAVTIDADALPKESQQAVEYAWSGAVSQAGDPLPATHLTVMVNPAVPLPQALSSLSQEVTLAAIEARRGELWMLHAAGLADEHGRTLVLIAPSGEGKTTAARTLATQLSYVSDETVSITPDGEVVPYRKPLSVIEDSAGLKAQRSPSELGLLPLPDAPLTAAAFVLLHRDPEHDPHTATLTEVELGEALPELVAQTSYIGDLPRPLRTIAALSQATGGIRRVTYSEASTLAEALTPLLTEPGQVTLPQPLHEPRPGASGEGTFRGGFLDAIALDDETNSIALLQPEPDGGSTLRIISGIGPALWQAADGATQTQLEAAAIEAYGEPEGVDAKHAVQEALTELIAQRVLATEPAWRIRTDVAYTGGGERYVAMSLADLMNPTPLALEGPAATIWGTLADSRAITPTRLVEVVAGRTGLTPPDVDHDVRAFLTTLEAQQLAEPTA